MALSFFTSSAAPNDIRYSSIESDGPSGKCVLCCASKRNFYCADCIKAGVFVNSSMPYSDRFAEKQLKLHRLKANRKYVQERCDTVLLSKQKRNRIMNDIKKCCDSIYVIRKDMEVKRSKIEENKHRLEALCQYNKELKLKLPKYEKRVATLGKHCQLEQNDANKKGSVYYENADEVAALRRSRMRQLNKYIFPVYITYDTSESIEEMEFLHVEPENEPHSRLRVHIVGPWLPADGDLSSLAVWQGAGAGGAAGAGFETHESPAVRCQAALSYAAQLLALLAWTLNVRLPNKWRVG